MIPVFNKLQAGAKKAFDRVNKVSGTETDSELMLYNQLKPQHFTELMKDYGEENILGYIREMEAKRLGVRRK